jgi:hypothetical protein
LARLHPTIHTLLSTEHTRAPARLRRHAPTHTDLRRLTRALAPTCGDLCRLFFLSGPRLPDRVSRNFYFLCPHVQLFAQRLPPWAKGYRIRPCANFRRIFIFGTPIPSKGTHSNYRRVGLTGPATNIPPHPSKGNTCTFCKIFINHQQNYNHLLSYKELYSRRRTVLKRAAARLPDEGIRFQAARMSSRRLRKSLLRRNCMRCAGEGITPYILAPMCGIYARCLKYPEHFFNRTRGATTPQKKKSRQNSNFAQAK